MRSILILAILALLVISCGNDFPSSVPAYKVCKYIDANGVEKEASINDIPEDDCAALGGTIDTLKY